MMTLTTISQVNYKINDSLYVCYTLQENRKIAIIFKEGERDNQLLELCNNKLSIKDSLINCYKKDSVLNKGLENSYKKAINECDSINAVMYRSYCDLQIANENKKMWIKGLIGISLFEILIIAILAL